MIFIFVLLNFVYRNNFRFYLNKIKYLNERSLYVGKMFTLKSQKIVPENTAVLRVGTIHVQPLALPRACMQDSGPRLACAGADSSACGVSEEPGWWESLAEYLAHIRYSIKIPWIVCRVMSFDMKAQVKFDQF